MRPLLLDPVVVAKPWGGRRLADLGVALPDDHRGYGEAWVVADLDPAATVQADPASRVRRGPHAGRTLSDLVGTHRVELLGEAPPHDGRFPLLVKLLDADQHLSVQVHPPAAVLADHPSARLKTESWVVVDCEPGAQLFLGLVPGVTREQVRAALGTPTLVDLLQRVPARPGDVFHVPAGLVHALGAGVVVAEVQTPSDTTWRLYDWTAEYGRGDRELHLDAGWQAIDASWSANTNPVRARRGDPRLLDTEHYTVDRHELAAGASLPGPDGAPRPRIVQVLDGAVTVDGHELGSGEVVLLPASDHTPVETLHPATVLVTAPQVPGA